VGPRIHDSRVSRRRFLLAAASAAAVQAGPSKLEPRERVERALRGEEVDRAPYTIWYHFGLEKKGYAAHARATLDFQRKFRTDIVKVMSDFPYPKPAGNWLEPQEEANPFPDQLRALEIIGDGLDGRKPFVETIFNPWNVAEKLSSRDELLRLKEDQPQKLLDALEIIARSEANHARRAVDLGASGIFLAIANAQESVLSQADYSKFSEPFDRMVLDAVRGARLNILHLHGDKVYLDVFYGKWPAAVIHYSVASTGVPMMEVRKQYKDVLMGGLNELRFRSLTHEEMLAQYRSAIASAGDKLIFAPGCSVPNDTTEAEINRLKDVLRA
jgi:uroporphyrinogen decarboxylase